MMTKRDPVSEIIITASVFQIPTRLCFLDILWVDCFEPLKPNISQDALKIDESVDWLDQILEKYETVLKQSWSTRKVALGFASI